MEYPAFSGFKFDGQGVSFRGGRPIEITGMPCLLLGELASRPGQRISYDHCRRAMGMEEIGGEVADHLKKIRSSLFDAAIAGGLEAEKAGKLSERVVETIRKQGLRLNADVREEVPESPRIAPGQSPKFGPPGLVVSAPPWFSKRSNWGIGVGLLLAIAGGSYVARRPHEARAEVSAEDTCPAGDARITRISQSVPRGDVRVEWVPPEPMVVQWYQNNACHPAAACGRSGGNQLSVSPLTLQIPTPGKTELKLWRENAAAPAHCVWFQME
jgi:hypothetical protein